MNGDKDEARENTRARNMIGLAVVIIACFIALAVINANETINRQDQQQKDWPDEYIQLVDEDENYCYYKIQVSEYKKAELIGYIISHGGEHIAVTEVSGGLWYDVTYQVSKSP